LIKVTFIWIAAFWTVVLIYFSLKVLLLKITIDQGSQTRGPPDVFVRPTTSLILLKLLLKLLFFCSIKALLASYCRFFVKMWPAYETEFETPAIDAGLEFEILYHTKKVLTDFFSLSKWTFLTIWSNFRFISLR